MDVNDILMGSVFNVTETPDFNQTPVSTWFLNLNATETNVTNTTENSLPLFHSYPKALLIFGAACCVLFTILGVPGNILTVIALLKSPKLRNATTVFIVNLCLADAFFSATSTPMEASNFIHREWIHGESLCILFAMLRSANVTVSLLTVTAITINRYILICHPYQYDKIFNRCNMTIIIISLWLASFGLCFPTLIGVWGRFGYDPVVGACTALTVNGKSPRIFVFIFIFFVLPTTVFLICYTRIYWVVRKSSKSFRPSDARAKKQKKDLRLLQIVAVIYGTFVLCFVPVVVVKILKKEKDWQVFNILGYLGVFVSACLNPVIYVVMSKDYRKAYSKLLTCNSANNQSTSSQSL